jgi:hypothetical protein
MLLLPSLAIESSITSLRRLLFCTSSLIYLHSAVYISAFDNKSFERLYPEVLPRKKPKNRIKMASATLPAEVQKVANEGVVKLFGKWDAQE